MEKVDNFNDNDDNGETYIFLSEKLILAEQFPIS